MSSEYMIGLKLIKMIMPGVHPDYLRLCISFTCHSRCEETRFERQTSLSLSLSLSLKPPSLSLSLSLCLSLCLFSRRADRPNGCQTFVLHDDETIVIVSFWLHSSIFIYYKNMIHDHLCVHACVRACVCARMRAHACGS